MAGDWIKMRNDLADDPAVIGIAARTGLDEFAVVGRLQHLWSWADRQSRDGHAVGVTGLWIDRHVRCDGFADAMVLVGWLTIKKTGIDFPNFDRHNGKSAKQRAVTTGRKAKQRANVTPNHEDVSRNERDEGVTREEKRREEKEHPRSRKSTREKKSPDGFEKFWSAYPRKTAKPQALKAFEKLGPDPSLLERMLAAVARQSKSDQWVKDGGQFIPHPATWLNNSRWEDQLPVAASRTDDLYAGAI